MRSGAGRRPKPHGFTLMEILVVLVIVSLISGILIQGLERSFRLQQRFGVELFNSGQGAMAADWFRQSIEGLLPDFVDGRNKFSGSARKLSGLTGNPVSTDYGAPGAFTWELRFDTTSGNTQLIYDDGKRADALMEWPGDHGGFSYLDARGDEHDTWPPPLGLWPQLPKGILLQGRRDGEALVLVAAPMGPTAALPRPQDLMGIAP